MIERSTKIVATLGPASDEPGVLDKLIEAGVDCVRINCSHGTADDLRRRAGQAREAADRAGRPVGVLFDLQGPKLRLAGSTATQTVEAGAQVVFVDSDTATTAGDGSVVVEYPDFARLCTARSQLVIGDGVPRLEVERIGEGEVVARALTPGPLSSRKGVNVTYARPSLPAITEKDAADIEVAATENADFVALSFVRSASDMEDLRARLEAHGSRARTIAKIEKIEAYDHLDEILAACDGVMVARGDYGVEAGVARVPLMQKDTIMRATRAGKFVITATQMLESMIHAPEPTRAEATDIANAVIDGTSAVMLSAETGVGEYPVQAVQAMAEIAHVAEEAFKIHGRAQGPLDETASEIVLHAAVDLGEALQAAALVIPTSTGGGARACAKFRIRRPIIALTHDKCVARQLTLEWGVRAIPIGVAHTVEELVEAALIAARDGADVPSGATVVLTAGRQTGTPGATSLIMVREIP